MEEKQLYQARKLFEENQKLAVYTLMHFFPERKLDNDLLQEAYLGLWLGCLHYDGTVGVTPATYLVKAIQNHIFQILNREKKCVEGHIPPVSIEQKQEDYEDGYLHKFRLDDTAPSKVIWIGGKTYEETFSDKERYIFAMKYRGYSNREIARKFGCTHQNIQQIIASRKEKFTKNIMSEVRT